MWLVLKVFLVTCSIALVKDYYTFTTLDRRTYIVLNNHTIFVSEKDIQRANTWVLGSIGEDLHHLSADMTTIFNIVDLQTQGRLRFHWILLWILLSPLKAAMWPFQLHQSMHPNFPVLLQSVHEYCFRRHNASVFTVEQFEACAKKK